VGKPPRGPQKRGGYGQLRHGCHGEAALSSSCKEGKYFQMLKTASKRPQAVPRSRTVNPAKTYPNSWPLRVATLTSYE